MLKNGGQVMGGNECLGGTVKGGVEGEVRVIPEIYVRLFYCSDFFLGNSSPQTAVKKESKSKEKEKEKTKEKKKGFFSK